VTRFQQTSPPVTAKGIEDTAFYRYNRLLALNEVGGEPARFGLSVADWHAVSARRAERHPRNLLITQTHDTKRSGDVRARIGALASMPAEWREHVLRWRVVNEPLRQGGAPDANEEYLIYQTLVGAWPIETGRLDAYLEKALREAKRNTSWVEQDAGYEARVQAFVRAILDHDAFLGDFLPFAERVAREGEQSALGQELLMLTAPGIPAIYQGDELTTLSLVDPDNRRPVDWAKRRSALDALREGAPPTRETRKLFVMWKALALRNRRPESFGPEGGYTPVEAGPGVVAYLRGDDVLVVVPVREWAEARLDGPDGRWADVLTGAQAGVAGASVAQLVAEHGVGLFERG
jgi:(1->4)-alpha-D-glucan 1-alpha-D-glucosylmutase